MTGCGSQSVATPPEIPAGFPPHGGIWQRISADSEFAFIEIVRKPGAAANTPEVTIYFYNQEFSPCDAAPESGVLWLNAEKNISLQSNDDGALVTPAGTAVLAKNSIEGTVLSVELDGQEKRIRVVQSER
jgi:hypothetical protein